MVGYALGWSLAGYRYGFKQVEVEPEIEEILEDENSLQYANYIKNAKRVKKGQIWYPGKIKD